MDLWEITCHVIIDVYCATILHIVFPTVTQVRKKISSKVTCHTLWLSSTSHILADIFWHARTLTYARTLFSHSVQHNATHGWHYITAISTDLSNVPRAKWVAGKDGTKGQPHTGAWTMKWGIFLILAFSHQLFALMVCLQTALHCFPKKTCAHQVTNGNILDKKTPRRSLNQPVLTWMVQTDDLIFKKLLSSII